MAVAAQMFADGRAQESVFCELRKRGLSPGELESSWEEVMEAGYVLMSERRKRLCFVGACWLLVGLVLLGGLAWALIFHGRLPWVLLIGAVPTWYGFYLLCLHPNKEPDFEAPRIFGKNL